MRRAVINLAANASDAMPDAGTLTISSRLRDGYWELQLSDTGSGIPSDLRPRIFEPFVTFGKTHGTGLGLAIVPKIVEDHGGTVDFRSWVSGEEAGTNSGSMFLIRVPVGELPEIEIAG